MALAAQILNLTPVGPVPPPTPTPQLLFNQGPVLGGATDERFDPRFDERRISVEVQTARVTAMVATSPVGARQATANVTAVVETDDEKKK